MSKRNRGNLENLQDVLENPHVRQSTANFMSPQQLRYMPGMQPNCIADAQVYRDRPREPGGGCRYPLRAVGSCCIYNAVLPFATPVTAVEAVASLWSVAVQNSTLPINRIDDASQDFAAWNQRYNRTITTGPYAMNNSELVSTKVVCFPSTHPDSAAANSVQIRICNTLKPSFYGIGFRPLDRADRFASSGVDYYDNLYRIKKMNASICGIQLPDCVERLPGPLGFRFVILAMYRYKIDGISRHNALPGNENPLGIEIENGIRDILTFVRNQYRMRTMTITLNLGITSANAYDLVVSLVNARRGRGTLAATFYVYPRLQDAEVTQIRQQAIAAGWQEPLPTRFEQELSQHQAAWFTCDQAEVTNGFAMTRLIVHIVQRTRYIPLG